MKIVLGASLVCFAGCLLCAYVGSLPTVGPPVEAEIYISEVFPLWTIWDYAELTFFVCGMGLTIAAVKVRRGKD